MSDQEPEGKLEITADDPLASLGKTSRLRGPLVEFFAFVFLLLHLLVALNSWPGPIERRALHIGLGFILLLLMIPTKSRFRFVGPVFDAALIGLLIFHCVYFLRIGPDLPLRAGLVYENEVWLALAVIIVTVECTRRVIGWGLTTTTLAALAYGLFGNHIPGQWGHGGFTLERLAGGMYLGFNGLFGTPTSVSVNFIYLFLLLAATLTVIGASKVLGDIAVSLFGSVRGGPAKVSTVGSGLFGMVTGSAVANAASVGAFTIPLMVRSGLKPKMAASVEAVSSVGGQFVPPIMGATAFVMAEFLGVSYSTIVLAAIIPAVTYYLALFLIVDFHAAQRDMETASAEMVAEAKRSFRLNWYLLVPLVIVLYVVAVLQYSPVNSALYGLYTCVGVVAVKALLQRVNPMPMIRESIKYAGNMSLSVVAAVGAAGIIIGILSLTGLGNKLSSLLLSLDGGSLLALLLLTMVGCIIVGAGLPTLPTYVILIVLLGPALIEFGVHPLAAHFFIFYFGVLSDLTPPTALSVVVTAGIANTNPWQTMFMATKVGIFGYLIPFLFVYYPTMLWVGPIDAYDLVISLISVFIAVVATAGIVERWCRYPLSNFARLLLLGAVISGLLHTTLGTISAVALFAVTIYLAGLNHKGHRRGLMRLFTRKRGIGDQIGVPAHDVGPGSAS